MCHTSKNLSRYQGGLLFGNPSTIFPHYFPIDVNNCPDQPPAFSPPLLYIRRLT